MRTLIKWIGTMACSTFRGFRQAPAVVTIAAAVLLAASSAMAQEVLRVDIYSGSVNGDGTAWGSSAYKYLQDAIAEAASFADAQNPYEIWVVGHTNPVTATANGYRPDLGNGLTSGDKSLSFNLRNQVEIYGGFAGTETQLQQRDPKTYITVLLGDLAGDDDWEVTYDLGSGLPIISVSATAIDDNSYHVVFAEEVDDTAILDGFTIRGGGDAAVLIRDARPRLMDCHIDNPSGAAVHCEGVSQAAFIRCRIASRDGSCPIEIEDASHVVLVDSILAPEMPEAIDLGEERGMRGALLRAGLVAEEPVEPKTRRDFVKVPTPCLTLPQGRVMLDIGGLGAGGWGFGLPTFQGRDSR